MDMLSEGIEFGARGPEELFCAACESSAGSKAVILHGRAKQSHLHEFIGRERIFGMVEARGRIIVEAQDGIIGLDRDFSSAEDDVFFHGL